MKLIISSALVLMTVISASMTLTQSPASASSKKVEKVK